MLTVMEPCMGSWDGDNSVFISWPLVATIGCRTPQDAGPDEYDPSDEWS